MRIAMVSLHTSPTEVPGRGDAGGMNVVVLESAQALAKLGHDVTIVTRKTDRIVSHETFQGVRLLALEAGPANLQKSELPTVTAEFGDRLAELGNFDVYHSHYWLSGSAAQRAASRTHVPQAITLHTVAAQKNANLAEGDSPEPAVRLEAEAEITRHAQVIAMSESEKNGIVAGYGEPLQPIKIVTPGVDTTLFNPSSASKPKNQGPKILVLGRVQPLKGQDLAMQAFIDFATKYPDLARNAQLIIAGEATPGQESFAEELRRAAYAAKLGSARITFLPAQSRAASAALLASSDLALIPSHSETFGLVALEAAACGTPVLAARVTGLLESVADKISGVLVEGRDPQSWATQIAALLGDPPTLNRMSAGAQEFAESHSWQSHAHALEAVYSEMLR